jgi:hypothetical protein
MEVFFICTLARHGESIATPESRIDTPIHAPWWPIMVRQHRAGFRRRSYSKLYLRPGADLTTDGQRATIQKLGFATIK